MRTVKLLGATTAMLVFAGVYGAAPAAADPSPKVLFSAELTGNSETTYPDPNVNVFHQETTFEVNGRYKNKSMTGELHYEYRVLLRGTDLPPELQGPFNYDPDEDPNDPDDDWVLVSQATLTTDLGSLSWETSPYSTSHIGFECLSDCALPNAAEHNAVILAFGQGDGIFASETFPELWTMRVERHGPPTGDVTGSLTGGVGFAFRYCAIGEVATVASTGAGELATAVSLTTTDPSTCRDENGNPVNNSLVGGPMNLDFRFNWDVVGDPPFLDQPIYPDVSARMWNDAGTMTGTTTSFGLLDPGFEFPYWSWYRHHIALGGEWGENDIEGVYAKYPYVYLDLSFGFPGNGTVPGTQTVDGTITGIVATYLTPT